MKLYRALVENNTDPEEIGRVQVRIYGVHSFNEERGEEGGTTESLPWAEVIGGNDFGLLDGVGVSSILRNNTLVWVLFEEGDVNKPIVLGVIKGKQNDQSDIAKVSRGDLTDGTIERKNNNLMSSTTPPEQAQTASEYGKSTTIKTESGGMLEFDDTEGNVRVQLIDSNGNYLQMSIDSYIEKAVSNKIDYIMKNYYVNSIGSTRILSKMGVHIEEDVYIGGKLYVDGKIISGADVFTPETSIGSLKTSHDTHTHTGNLGAPTSPPLMANVGPGDGSFSIGEA